MFFDLAVEGIEIFFHFFQRKVLWKNISECFFPRRSVDSNCGWTVKTFPPDLPPQVRKLPAGAENNWCISGLG